MSVYTIYVAEFILVVSQFQFLNKHFVIFGVVFQVYDSSVSAAASVITCYY